MTTPPYSDPNQPPDPSRYQPDSDAEVAPPLDGIGGQQQGGYSYQPDLTPPTGNQTSGEYPGQGFVPGQPPGYFPGPGSSAAAPGTPPGYGQPPGYVPGQVPGYQPQQPKASGKKILSVILIVAVLAVGGFFAYQNFKSNPDNAKVGDCVQWNSNTDVNVVNCDSADAQYRVELRVDDSSDFQHACDSTFDTDVALYTQDDSGPQYVLCVSLVLKDGTCLFQDEDEQIDVIDCGDPRASFQVAEIVTNTQDFGVCTDDQYPWPQESQNQIVCIEDK